MEKTDSHVHVTVNTLETYSLSNLEYNCPDQTMYTKQIEDVHDIKLFICASPYRRVIGLKVST